MDSISTNVWQRKGSHLQALLHRELIYSGIINDEMSYSATPLAVVGVEAAVRRMNRIPA